MTQFYSITEVKAAIRSNNRLVFYRDNDGTQLKSRIRDDECGGFIAEYKSDATGLWNGFDISDAKVDKWRLPKRKTKAQPNDWPSRVIVEYHHSDSIVLSDVDDYTVSLSGKRWKIIASRTT